MRAHRSYFVNPANKNTTPVRSSPRGRNVRTLPYPHCRIILAELKLERGRLAFRTRDGIPPGLALFDVRVGIVGYVSVRADSDPVDERSYPDR